MRLNESPQSIRRDVARIRSNAGLAPNEALRKATASLQGPTVNWIGLPVILRRKMTDLVRSEGSK